MGPAKPPDKTTREAYMTHARARPAQNPGERASWRETIRNPPQTALDPWAKPREPDGAEADFARAADLHRQGRLEAKPMRCISARPSPRTRNMPTPFMPYALGVMQIQVGRYPHALALIDQALALRPDYADAHLQSRHRLAKR